MAAGPILAPPMSSADHAERTCPMRLGFEVSAWRRVIVALLLVLGALGMRWAAEHAGRSRDVAVIPPAVVSATSATVTVALTIESTRPVATWAVSCLGEPAQQRSIDAHRWQGEVRAAAGEDILIEVATGAVDGSAAPQALRVVVAGQPEQVFWSVGDQVVSVPVPSLAGRGAP
jgi:hypothetical protein